MKRLFGMILLALSVMVGSGLWAETEAMSEMVKLEKAAKAGNVNAQVLLAGGYQFGKPGEDAFERALYWCRKAAEQGDVCSQINLGNIYARGDGKFPFYEGCQLWYFSVMMEGALESGTTQLPSDGKSFKVKRSPEEAMRWFMKAAEAGDKPGADTAFTILRAFREVERDLAKKPVFEKRWKAIVEKGRSLAKAGNRAWQRVLAEAYYDGKGVEQSFGEALELFRMAAEQGCVSSMVRLGNMYRYGSGVEASVKEAVKWYSKAAKEESVEGAWCAQELMEANEALFMMPEIRQRQDELKELVHRKAENGDTYAQRLLGIMYSEGKWESRSCREAVKWFSKAAEDGDIVSRIQLARCYYVGDGVTQSYELAAFWYRCAALEKDRDAEYLLGWCYEHGEGVEKSPKIAAYWYLRAAKQGHRSAQYMLACLYRDGEGVPQSYKEAFRWFKEAAEAGHLNAKYELGLLYEAGKGVEQSDGEACRWFASAAREEHAASARAFNRVLSKQDLRRIEEE